MTRPESNVPTPRNQRQRLLRIPPQRLNSSTQRPRNFLRPRSGRRPKDKREKKGGRKREGRKGGRKEERGEKRPPRLRWTACRTPGTQRQRSKPTPTGGKCGGIPTPTPNQRPQRDGEVKPTPPGIASNLHAAVRRATRVHSVSFKPVARRPAEVYCPTPVPPLFAYVQRPNASPAAISPPGEEL